MTVPRAAVTVSGRDVGELKLRNLRDQLEKTITRTEGVLKIEGLVILRLQRERKPSSARVLLLRRKHLRERIRNADGQLNVVSDMIVSLGTAKDQKMLLEALKEGSKTINEINSEMNKDVMKQVLEEHGEAVGYVKEVSDEIVNEGGIGIGRKCGEKKEEDEELKEILKELKREFGDDQSDQSDQNQVNDPIVDRIPDVPVVQVTAVHPVDSPVQSSVMNTKTGQVFALSVLY